MIIVADQPMDHGGRAEQAGYRLRQLRLHSDLSLRDVEALSRRLAGEKQNSEYIVSRGWLNNVENRSLTPSIYKLYSLSVLYHETWPHLLSLFGLRIGDIELDQTVFAPRKTQLVSESGTDQINRGTMYMPVKLRQDVEFDKTNLLARLAEIWGEVPIRFLQHLDLRRCTYGLIGTSDYTMYPILRPGSIVQIDGNQRKIVPAKWDDEHERPIYFIELRGGYICSWCEIQEGHLWAVPYPNSKCEVRRFAYPRDAEIVGQVTGVAMRVSALQP